MESHLTDNGGHDGSQMREAPQSVAASATLDFYRQFIQPGALCFDVGANYGNRTRIFLELGARVIAFEPQEDCVKTLRSAYGQSDRLTVVEAALGKQAGMAFLHIAEPSTIASLSPEWIEAVKTSGRFKQYHWDNAEQVEMTTLDRAIAEYGIPQFIKIDVEGYEDKVLAGLSQPVAALSFEFVPEFTLSTFQCIHWLCQLGKPEFNYARDETMQLALDQWVSAEDLKKELATYAGNHTFFGDIYARFW